MATWEPYVASVPMAAMTAPPHALPTFDHTKSRSYRKIGAGAHVCLRVKKNRGADR